MRWWVVAIGALALGVPLAGTIALVAFVTSYVPYLGAFVAGAFAVLIAYGSGGLAVLLTVTTATLLFGVMGAILAAPLTSAGVNAYHQLRGGPGIENLNEGLET
jgi:predicted PurR-regulated permease PerM